MNIRLWTLAGILALTSCSGGPDPSAGPAPVAAALDEHSAGSRSAWEEPAAARTGSPRGSLLTIRAGGPTAAPLAEVDPSRELVSQPMVEAVRQRRQFVMPAEGAVVVDRVGWMFPSDSPTGWSFRFEQLGDEEAQLAPMGLLPSPLLSGMEGEIADRGGEMLTFRVSGEVTAYRNRRYLLIRKALVEVDAPAPVLEDLPSDAAVDADWKGLEDKENAPGLYGEDDPDYWEAPKSLQP